MAAGDHISRASFSDKALAIFDLVKPELPIAAGICVVAGQIIASGAFPTAFVGLIGFLTGFFISGAAMISNDYFDLEVDRINHPERPLPSRRVSTLEVLILTGVFSAAGLILSAFLGIFALAMAAILLIISILYNWKYKESGLPGNMMVAFCVSMTFILGGMTVGALTNGIVLTFGALAFIFDLSEEIASGAMDAEGDRLRSSRSLANLRGRDYALRVSGLLFVLFTLLSFLPYAAGWLDNVYLALVTVTDILVLFFAYKLLKSRMPVEGRTQIRRIYLTVTLFIILFIIYRIF